MSRQHNHLYGQQIHPKTAIAVRNGCSSLPSHPSLTALYLCSYSWGSLSSLGQSKWHAKRKTCHRVSCDGEAPDYGPQKRTARRDGATRCSDNTVERTGAWVVAETGSHGLTANTASHVATWKLAGIYRQNC